MSSRNRLQAVTPAEVPANTVGDAEPLRRGHRNGRSRSPVPSGRVRGAMRAAFRLLPVLDLLLLSPTYLAGMVMKSLRRVGGPGIVRLPRSKLVLRRIGVYPLHRHYYDPLCEPADLHRALSAERPLPGLDLNVEGQLALLERLGHAAELTQIPTEPQEVFGFYYDNGWFESGDAEYYYQILRHFRPRMLIEVGGGFSTLIARRAIEANRGDDPAYRCRHVCIEPFENPWLDGLEVELLRTPVERCDPALFAALGPNDILFIDSSHVIRPQGDVLCEYLEILPTLSPGVLVHVHDILTPRDYPAEWIFDRVLLWNEQYLLEGFLSFNSRFEVIGALNHLHHRYPEALHAKCPVLARQAQWREPGSFWIRRLA